MPVGPWLQGLRVANVFLLHGELLAVARGRGKRALGLFGTLPSRYPGRWVPDGKASTAVSRSRGWQSHHAEVQRAGPP